MRLERARAILIGPISIDGLILDPRCTGLGRATLEVVETIYDRRRWEDL